MACWGHWRYEAAFYATQGHHCCCAQVEAVVQQYHKHFLQACAGVEALEDQVGVTCAAAEGGPSPSTPCC